MHPYVYLGLAIILEVVGTSLLKVSDGFTKPWAVAGMIATYFASFYFLSLTLKVIPTGIAYAIWSGVGIVLIAGIGWVAFKQNLNMGELLGLGLIIAGVIVLNFSSQPLS